MTVSKTLVREWLATFEPNLFQTFNFGYKVSPEVGGSSIIRFFNRLQRCVHGRNWSKRKTEQPMLVIGFWEHLDSNPHCHVIIRATKEEWRWLLNKGNAFWLEQQKRGQLHFEKIESPEKVISYITKEFAKPDSQERMIVYKAPLNKA